MIAFDCFPSNKISLKSTDAMLTAMIDESPIAGYEPFILQKD